MASSITPILDNINKIIVGKESTIKLVLTALLANGHILLEDLPGSGKTMLAKSIAASFDFDCKRIQFTPDLLPSDITGISIYNQKTSSFEFHEGPAFTNLLLADEINRATPRTQSSLLECMGEHQITVEGSSRPLETPFFVLATQNPLESSGTFPLPEAQIDRFTMKLSLGFPSKEEEIQIMKRFEKNNPLDSLSCVASKEDLISYQKQAKQVFIHDELISYIAAIINATRNHPSIAYGISPRGTLALMDCCRAYAFIEGRDYVLPDDIKTLAIPVLAHRLGGLYVSNPTETSHKLINEILNSIPVPTENWEK